VTAVTVARPLKEILVAMTTLKHINVRTAVIGDGLALSDVPSGRFTIYETLAGHANAIGTFDNVRDAWELIDQLDLAELEVENAQPLAA
jgi:hypothetical protein